MAFHAFAWICLSTIIHTTLKLNPRLQTYKYNTALYIARERFSIVSQTPNKFPTFNFYKNFKSLLIHPIPAQFSNY